MREQTGAALLVLDEVDSLETAHLVAAFGAPSEVLVMMDPGQQMDPVNNAPRAPEAPRVEGSARFLRSLPCTRTGQAVKTHVSVRVTDKLVVIVI